MKAVKERPKLPKEARSSTSLIGWVPGERYRCLTVLEQWEGVLVVEDASHLVFKRDSVLSQKALSHDGVVESLPDQWIVSKAQIARATLWEP